MRLSSFDRTLSAIDSCMITRRVEVQRWPAVPTAPKNDRSRCQLQIGARRHDQRVVAAKLHHGSA